MTETQAQSGGAGTSTEPVDTPRKDPAANAPGADSAKSAGADGADAAGRVVVGRAAVPGDGRSSSSDQATAAAGGTPASGRAGVDGAAQPGQATGGQARPAGPAADSAGKDGKVPAPDGRQPAGSPAAATGGNAGGGAAKPAGAGSGGKDAPVGAPAAGGPGKGAAAVTGGPGGGAASGGPGAAGSVPRGQAGAGAGKPAGGTVSGKPAGGPGGAASGSATADPGSQTSRFTRAPGMAPPPESLDDMEERTKNLGQAGTADARSVSTGRATVNPGQRPGGAPGATGVGRASVQSAAGAPGAPTGRIGAATSVGSAKVTEAGRRGVPGAAQRGPRRARLFLKRIDPWSVMKFSFAVSFVLLVVAVVATSVLYLALDAMGVFDSVNRALSDMVSATGSDSSTFKITAKGVIFGSTLLGAINVVLFTALATLAAFIYNVCADLVGGVELTLAEKD